MRYNQDEGLVKDEPSPWYKGPLLGPSMSHRDLSNKRLLRAAAGADPTFQTPPVGFAGVLSQRSKHGGYPTAQPGEH